MDYLNNVTIIKNEETYVYIDENVNNLVYMSSLICLEELKDWMKSKKKGRYVIDNIQYVKEYVKFDYKCLPKLKSIQKLESYINETKDIKLSDNGIVNGLKLGDKLILNPCKDLKNILHTKESIGYLKVVIIKYIS